MRFLERFPERFRNLLHRLAFPDFRSVRNGTVPHARAAENCLCSGAKSLLKRAPASTRESAPLSYPAIVSSGLSRVTIARVSIFAPRCSLMSAANSSSASFSTSMRAGSTHSMTRIAFSESSESAER